MNVRSWVLSSLPLLLTMAAGAETRYLDPPPLNPHPKETLHVTVAFDRPKDAERYTIAMMALYQNRRGECGYVHDEENDRFVYLEGTFEIPNKSHDRRRARFDIHLDKYNRDTCSWEFGKPYVLVRDTHTTSSAVGSWGIDDDLIPGTAFKVICPFPDGLWVHLPCFDRRNPVPDTAFFNHVPASRRIPITIRVSEDSAPMRSRQPSFYNNFAKPMTPNDAARSPSQNGND